MARSPVITSPTFLGSSRCAYNAEKSKCHNYQGRSQPRVPMPRGFHFDDQTNRTEGRNYLVRRFGFHIRLFAIGNHDFYAFVLDLPSLPRTIPVTKSLISCCYCDLNMDELDVTRLILCANKNYRFNIQRGKRSLALLTKFLQQSPAQRYGSL